MLRDHVELRLMSTDGITSMARWCTRCSSITGEPHTLPLSVLDLCEPNDWLIRMFDRHRIPSATWRQFSKATQGTYRGIIERLRTNYGGGSVRALPAQHILKMRDRKADVPTAANNLVKVARWMLSFAVAGSSADNPPLASSPSRSCRLAFPSGLKPTSPGLRRIGQQARVSTWRSICCSYTAQQSGDVRQMRRQHVQGSAIFVRQEKTRAFLELPVHTRLKASLDMAPSG